LKKRDKKMNETLKTILSRRSIRRYNQEQITEEELKTILEAGSFAPSAMNQQSWHFTVVQNSEKLKKINEASKAVLSRMGSGPAVDRMKIENFSVFYSAPTLIIVTGDSKAIAPQNDGSLALGNMLLAAESLGVGSCWIHALSHVFNSQEGKALKLELGIPEAYDFVGSGAFGYKAMEQPSPSPRKEGAVNFAR
jgi:nitroreductase